MKKYLGILVAFWSLTSACSGERERTGDSIEKIRSLGRKPQSKQDSEKEATYVEATMMQRSVSRYTVEKVGNGFAFDFSGAEPLQLLVGDVQLDGKKILVRKRLTIKLECDQQTLEGYCGEHRLDQLGANIADYVYDMSTNSCSALASSGTYGVEFPTTTETPVANGGVVYSFDNVPLPYIAGPPKYLSFAIAAEDGACKFFTLRINYEGEY